MQLLEIYLSGKCKIAEPNKEPSLSKGKALAATALGAGAGALLPVLGMRGLRTHLADTAMGLFGKGGRKAEMGRELPAGALQQADDVLRALRKAGINPKKARIAVSGTGGTGKTTLGRALAQRAGLEHLKLDVTGSSARGGHEAWLAANPPGKGTVLDQTHLFTQAEPDRFDALVHLERPTPNIIKDLIKRKRGAHQASLYDYKKLHKDISAAFENTRGTPVVVSDNLATGGMRVRVKTKERKGLFGRHKSFGAHEILDEKLWRSGIDPTGMTRAQKIQSLTDEHPNKVVTGPFRYYKKGPLAALGAGATGGGVGGYASSQ